MSKCTCPNCGAPTGLDGDACHFYIQPDTKEIEQLVQTKLDLVREIEQQQMLRKATERELTASRQEVEGFRESLTDKRRLTRELDVAMHGEENAAKQASLCDLIVPAQRLRERVESAEHQLTELQAKYATAVALLQEIYDWTNAKHTHWAVKTKDALTSTPQSILNLLAVLEAVKKMANRYFNGEKWDAAMLDAIEAYRKWARGMI